MYHNFINNLINKPICCERDVLRTHVKCPLNCLFPTAPEIPPQCNTVKTTSWNVAISYLLYNTFENNFNQN